MFLGFHTMYSLFSCKFCDTNKFLTRETLLSKVDKETMVPLIFKKNIAAENWSKGR